MQIQPLHIGPFDDSFVWPIDCHQNRCDATARYKILELPLKFTLDDHNICRSQNVRQVFTNRKDRHTYPRESEKGGKIVLVYRTIF